MHECNSSRPDRLRRQQVSVRSLSSSGVINTQTSPDSMGRSFMLWHLELNNDYFLSCVFSGVNGTGCLL